MNAKRGYIPEDDKLFSVEAISKMRVASRHIIYLINEGYDLKQASTFVGNHFLLSERQRLAIILDHCKSWTNLGLECAKTLNARCVKVW